MFKILALVLLGLASCQPVQNGDESIPIEKSVVMTMDSVTTDSVQKPYSLDEIYQNYISKELLLYLEKNHPGWSVPNQNKWHPQLFAKYKTATSLVNYIRADFDCNGKPDEVLIIGKGANVLAAVAFLAVADSFKTTELTELGAAGEKIEFVLTLYKRGTYKISDPDLKASDSKTVTFTCSGAGIGLFNELYEGGNDVYYWKGNNLMSCVIEN